MHPYYIDNSSCIAVSLVFSSNLKLPADLSYVFDTERGQQAHRS